jgi:hypothetical protein
MVYRAIFVVLTIAVAAPAAAQEFGILDNSFLVEEAFNQEAGVFQNIGTYRWQRGQWLATFTQEWPLPNQTHQLSFTIPFGRVLRSTSIGDVFVNYRHQVLEETDHHPAFAPRVSLIVPFASDDSGLGTGVIGWQFNAPFSKRGGNWYFHWNGGLTFVPADHDTFGDEADALVSPFVAGSAIWQASSTLNLLVEVVGESFAIWTETGAAERTGLFTISPGFRYAWNPGNKQVVVGLAVPIVRREALTSGGVFSYFSYELPFR